VHPQRHRITNRVLGGIYLYNSVGQGTVVARNDGLGTAVDGPNGSDVFVGFQGGALSLNASGQIAFGALVSDSNGAQTNRVYVAATGSSGDVTYMEIARGGITYSDANGGNVGLNSYGSPAMNDSRKWLSRVSRRCPG